MRRLIESLTPAEHQISWKWIGGMFAFYIVVMAVAAGLFATHHSRANLAQEAGTTVASRGKSAARANAPRENTDATATISWLPGQFANILNQPR
jgi:hypothetical protein